MKHYCNVIVLLSGIMGSLQAAERGCYPPLNQLESQKYVAERSKIKALLLSSIDEIGRDNIVPSYDPASSSLFDSASIDNVSSEQLIKVLRNTAKKSILMTLKKELLMVQSNKENQLRLQAQSEYYQQLLDNKKEEYFLQEADLKRQVQDLTIKIETMNSALQERNVISGIGGFVACFLLKVAIDFLPRFFVMGESEKQGEL